MNTAAPTVGSHSWQLIFLSFAAVVILFEVLRGWRLGLLRQIVRLFALAAAYAAAIFGGQMVAPFARAFLRLPDFALSAVGGALFAMLVYAVINGIGSMLFKRTAQQESGFVRLIFGASGAFLGVFFAGFFLWLLLIGIRAVGSVAEAQVRAQASEPLPPNAQRIVNGRLVSARSVDTNSLPELLARVKNSLEIGPLGEVMKRTDPLPDKSLQTLTKFTETFSKRDTAERFLSFPGARDLTMHPRIVQLREDPQIQRMLAEGRYLELLQDRRVIDAMNDPTLIDRLKKFDFQQALDYAKQPAANEQ